MKKILSFIMVIAMIASFSACSEKAAGNTASAPDVSASDALSAVTKVEKTESTVLDTAVETNCGAVTTVPSFIPDLDGAMAMGEAMEGEYGFIADTAPSFGGGGTAPENKIEVQSGTLTAGIWDDNDHWTFWNSLYQKEETRWTSFSGLWDKAITERYFATVSNNGVPLENIKVSLVDKEGNAIWNAKTDSEGKCWLFVDATANNEAKIIADINGTKQELPVQSTTDSYNFKVTDVQNAEQQLDLLLMVDTTGSMGDELDYLKAELDSIIKNVVKENSDVKIRVSVNFYRDEGDEYVVRSFDFTDDIAQAIKDLGEQSYDGGGDTPEAVHTALNDAISNHSWNENSTKLMLFVLDAPCHGDHQILDSVNKSVKKAAEMGVRIIPVVSSGSDKETEYLMRDMAIKTGGRYVFLTDHSGVSVGGHIEPTIGDYEVQKLNTLLVDTISSYLDRSKLAEYTDIAVEFKAPEPEGEIGLEMVNCKVSQDGGVVLNLLIKNDTNSEICYGAGPQMLTVENSDMDGGWEGIEVKPDVSWISIAYIVEAGKTSEYTINLEEFYGKLSKGNYRFFFTDLGTYDDVPEVPYVDFTIA